MLVLDVCLEDGEIEGEVGENPSSPVFDDGDVKAKLRRLDAAINGSPSASARLLKKSVSSPPEVANTPFRSKKEEKQWKRSQAQAAQAAPAELKQQPGTTPGYFDVYGPNVSIPTI